MKYIFFFLLLLAALGQAKAQDGEKCADIPFISTSINPNPIHVPPGLDPTPNPPLNTPPIEGYRGIYWVHGLGGDTDSWIKAYTATDGDDPTAEFPARKTKSIGMTYSQVGLNQSGRSLLDNIFNEHDLMASRVDDFSNNFIIAHSQGGFVSRKADQLLDNYPTERQHYGIVTFGSPHQGAKIVNSRNEGRITEWLADGCTFRVNASVNEFFANRPILDLFVNTDPITQQVGNVCDFAVSNLLPFALNGLFGETSNSYAIGDTNITRLNAHNNTNIKKVAFYGVEHNGDSTDVNFDPTDNEFVAKQALWRLFSSQRANVSSLPPFTADDDQEMVDKTNETIAGLYAQYIHYGLLSQEQNADCSPIPYICGRASKKTSEAYYAAYEWFNNADKTWKSMTGHLSFGPDPSGLGICEGSTGPNANVGFTACMVAGGQYWWPYLVETARPSDGVVLVESAKAFPGAKVGNALEGSNHFQMRNDSQLKLRLTELYDGTIEFWFRTEAQ